MVPRPPTQDTCPRCAAPKAADLWLCDGCYQREPRCCARCYAVDVLLAGLCATCAADELDADTDPDAAIPYSLTAQGLAALAAVPVMAGGSEDAATHAHLLYHGGVEWCGLLTEGQRLQAAWSAAADGYTLEVVAGAHAAHWGPPPYGSYAGPTGPQTGSQGPHGAIRGEAPCPRCGTVRGVVFDGNPVRCYNCHRHWRPEPAPIVA